MEIGIKYNEYRFDSIIGININRIYYGYEPLLNLKDKIYNPNDYLKIIEFIELLPEVNKKVSLPISEGIKQKVISNIDIKKVIRYKKLYEFFIEYIKDEFNKNFFIFYCKNYEKEPNNEIINVMEKSLKVINGFLNEYPEIMLCV